MKVGRRAAFLTGSLEFPLQDAAITMYLRYCRRMVVVVRAGFLVVLTAVFLTGKYPPQLQHNVSTELVS